MRILVAVALGSALGGVGRYLVGTAIQQRSSTAFPWGTLVVNVVGSFVLGAVARAATLHPNISPEARLFLTAGFCGGFTTFSTLSFEAVALLQGGETRRALLYLSISVVVGLLAVLAGFAAANALRD